MAYTYITIQDLPELLTEDIDGSEYLLISKDNETSKIDLNNINEFLNNAFKDTSITLTNKILDDITNFVQSNNTRFFATAGENLIKGQPVKVISTSSDKPTVIGIGSNDTSVGVIENDVSNGSICEVIINGVLEYDTNLSPGTKLYATTNGVQSTPITGQNIQLLGIVLKPTDINSVGKILINLEQSKQSLDINFSNINFNSKTVYDAILELKTKIITIPKSLISSNKVTLQKKAIGDVIMNYAFIYDTVSSEYYTEYTCNISGDGLSVEFSPTDNLNGKYAVFSYLAKEL